MRRTASIVAVVLASGCDLPASDASDGGDAGATCGATTCTSTQICLYRECTAAEKCRPSATCRSNETPSVCSDGQPGCLVSQCGPVVQGCRDVPSSCKSTDVACACSAVCGSAGGCKQVDGRNALCAGS